MNNLNCENLLKFSVFNASPDTCADEIASSALSTGHARWLACLNPHSYAVALKRPEFANALLSADWLVPDGVGILIGSRILGGRIRRRVTGYDVFVGTHDRLQDAGDRSVFFLGSTEETLTRICAKMASDWPDIRIAGTYSPPFKSAFTDNDIDEMVDRINRAKPDVLWVGMTAPKQEEWIHRVRGSIDVRFAAAIGAVFDFYAGNISRSPLIFRRLGLEWLPRLIQEPKRLWRRTFLSAPVFFWHVLRARLTP